MALMSISSDLETLWLSKTKVSTPVVMLDKGYVEFIKHLKYYLIQQILLPYVLIISDVGISFKAMMSYNSF